MKRYFVMASAPEQPTRVIACDDVEDCLDVVQGEGADQPVGAILNIIRVDDGQVVPMARWAVSKRGLVRGRGYRRVRQ